MERILRLKKRDFRAAEHVGTLAYLMLTYVLNGIRNRVQTKGIMVTLKCLLNFRHTIRTRIRERRAQMANTTVVSE